MTVTSYQKGSVCLDKTYTRAWSQMLQQWQHCNAMKQVYEYSCTQNNEENRIKITLFERVLKHFWTTHVHSLRGVL